MPRRLLAWSRRAFRCGDKQSPCGAKNERGSANRVRRVEDKSGRRFRLRDHCDMRRINLDGRRVCPLRHESLGGRWNGVVLPGDHVPRRDRFPRGLTGQGYKRLVGERSLFRLHLVSNLERQVGRECLVERRLLYVQVDTRTAVRKRILTEIQGGGSTPRGR